MTESEPKPEVSQEEAIVSALESSFSLLQDYSKKSQTPINEFLINTQITREKDVYVYGLIINPFASKEGKPDVLVVNVLRGLLLVGQYVASAQWEDEKPKINQRSFTAFTSNINGFDELEIAETTQMIIENIAQKLDIEQSSKIFPFNQNFSNRLS